MSAGDTVVAWVIAEHQDGMLHRGTTEQAAAARQMGARTVGVVCADPARSAQVGEQLAPFVDSILLLEHDDLCDYSLDGYGQAIVGAAAAASPESQAEHGAQGIQGGVASPQAILLPHAPLGRDLGPALAARLGSGMISDCQDLAWDDGLVGTRSVYRRKLLTRERVTGSAPHIATCQRGAFPPQAPSSDPPDAGSFERVSVSISDIRGRQAGVESVASSGAGEDITSADIVVAGGRGLGDAEKFAIVSDLAAACGGVMAASRPVVDQGWVPHDRQVGSSGVTVRPKLYIALGISGAIQHIVGMRESDVIVAVNKDGDAPIFEYAHYGIVDDVFKVIPALISALSD